VHQLFDATVYVKGIDGVLQIIGGIILLTVSNARVTGILGFLTTHELSRNPRDIVARAIASAAASLSADSQFLGALYLLLHGVVKVALVVALLKRLLWAYPAALVVFALFLVYQVDRYTHGHSILMLALCVLDVLVIAMTAIEYQRLRRTHGAAA
jgi:uncharacterized membrane protein